MTMRVLRKRHRTKAVNRPTPPLALTLRADVPLGSGVHALYPLHVAEREINRDAWAQVVSDLMGSETRGKIAPFARLVGVDPRTVSRWLKGEVDVSEESVREVARKTGRPPMGLLIQVGYYRRGELVPDPPAQARDEEMQLILSAPVDEDTKRIMIERLTELRERDKQRRMDDLRYLLERRTGT